MHTVKGSLVVLLFYRWKDSCSFDVDDTGDKE